MKILFDLHRFYEVKMSGVTAGSRRLIEQQGEKPALLNIKSCMLTTTLEFGKTIMIGEEIKNTNRALITSTVRLQQSPSHASLVCSSISKIKKDITI